VRSIAICAIALAFGFFGSTPLAGPISLLVVSRAARGRFEDARRIGWGAAIAEAFYAGTAFWGFATFFSRYAFIVPLSHGLTAVILVLLGLRLAVSAPQDQRRGEQNKTGSFLLGFWISALNPTLLVTWSAAVAFLYSKGLGVTAGAGAIPFGACAGAGIACWFSLFVALLRKYEGRVPRTLLAAIVRVLGVALLALGLWSGIQLLYWLRGERAAPTRAAASQCHFVASARQYRVPSSRVWTGDAHPCPWWSTASITMASRWPSNAHGPPSGLALRT
jgi:threonine/homoserine/homoserine lactone efflux protein